MNQGIIILFILTVLGIIGKNDLVATAAVILMGLVAVGSSQAIDFLSQYSVQVGIIFLLIGLLLPFILEKLNLVSVLYSLLSPMGLISVGVGILSAYLAAEGISFLGSRPEVMVGLVVGSVIGVSWLDGVPAGPLVAAGFAAVLYRWLFSN
jgi:uncharacterized membrane protein (DUF441 family)